ncbi:16S rRNA (guanine(527)-N(7))-methyltransferase RsmG [uncultured Tateyamaria sp.]|uniref:16S rRNA (guanine(527)-N(7))-methyltransferase RsmG n=1 Tax=uncultured Tateyamaria sp. TaxID=455651 RepID=UPI002612E651|nr:16S rRNA (guanine(527)-N(7))-methyltransferase RsmG [uncultured Tateyamaria sp.]
MRVPEWYSRDVSRETLEKLDGYAALLRKWTSKINLISKASVDDLENRHIWDSAQVYIETTESWLDLGSGGGLPGVVVAILAQGDGHDLPMTMVESDQRKSTFLRACTRELDVPFTVIAERIEKLTPQSASVVSARALANLDTLLGLAKPHLSTEGQCVFMKGAAWADELVEAERNWRFSCEATPSRTNPEAAILRIKGIERV